MEAPHSLATSIKSVRFNEGSRIPFACMISFDFLPDSERARAMDARMRGELLSSLNSICAQTRAQDAALSRSLEPVATVTKKFANRTTPFPPALFAAYYQLVLTLVHDADALDEKVLQLVEVATDADSAFVARFKDLSEAALGGPARLDLYRFALDTDPAFYFKFQSPTPECSQRTIFSIERALRLMTRTAPALREEFDALVHELILAASPEGPGAVGFDGASSYMLWGALALSVDERQSDLQRMETLAHECAHSLLFGFSIDEPLVLNDDSDRYSSPVRQDPRPMDGIYHATYVSARMHYAMCSARNSGLLDDAQQAEVQARMASSERAFFSGLSVVEAHADLSPTGQAVMEAAVAYMRSAASGGPSGAS